MADSVGVLALGVLIALARFVAGSGTDVLSWGIIYLTFVVVSLSMWHSSGWNRGAFRAKLILVGSAFFGTTFFLIDLVGARLSGGPTGTWRALRAQHTFGLPLTLLVFPGLFVVGLASMIRDWLWELATDSPDRSAP